MSTDRDRDPLDDQFLRAALRPNEPASADACLDAETLAAWASGALTADQADATDLHLATCARCQALLATFASTEDAAAASAVEPGVAASDALPSPVAAKTAPLPFRARAAARWIPIAAGTLAASLLIWIAWPKGVTTDRAEQAMASATPAASPAVPAPTTPAPAQAPSLTDRLSAAETKSMAKAVDERSDRRPPGRSTATPTPRPAPSETRATAAAPIAPSAAPAPLPTTVIVTGGAVASPPVTFLPPPPPAAVGATAAANRPEVVMLRGSADATARAEPVRVIAEFASPIPPTTPIGQSLIGGAGAGGGGGRGGGGGAGRGGLPAPGRGVARVAWRVLVSGQVERSIDAGTTWLPVTISPPAVIVNGAAPSPLVCWLVGRTGIVLRSVDGTTFRRVPFRDGDVSDLRSITAVDELQATVTTTDGRVFTTDNGGESWTKKDVN